MDSDAKNVAEPVSIVPGKLLRIAVKHELAPPPDGASDDGDSAFRRRLESTLKAWQRDIFHVTFATAFRILGSAIIGDPINPLEEPQDASKKIIYKEVFNKLVESPEPSYGKWPWAMMRDEEDNKPHSMIGAFPPCFILIADPPGQAKIVTSPLLRLSIINPESLPKTDKDVSELRQKIASTPDESKNLKCWEAYAVIPSLVADELRGGEKKTRALIYVLGTRREFLRRWHDLDWGMIVGLTIEVRNANADDQRAIIDAVLASWNLLAAAPFAIAQSSRISELYSQQKVTHIFKTQAEKLRNRLALVDQDVNRRLVRAIDNADEFLGLIHLSHFVSKGGLASPEFSDKKSDKESTEQIIAIRPQDWEKYDIVGELKSYFENSPFGVSSECSVEGSSKREGNWVSKHYLFAVLDELINNIAQEKINKAKWTIKIDSDILSISTRNQITQEKAETVLRTRGYLKEGITAVEACRRQSLQRPRGYDLPTGEAAAAAFFSCLGGEYDGKVAEERNGKEWFYNVVMSYDLKDWQKKQAEAERSQEGIKLDDVKVSRKSQSQREPPPEGPTEQPSIRVLLLDDYRADPQDAMDGFSECFQHDLKFKRKEYKRSFPSSNDSSKDSNEFSCLGLYEESDKSKELTFLGLEIVLCTRLKDASDWLATEHFDILLIDVDFGREDGAPPLGGILFALIPRPDSVIRIMTAVHSTLRDNPDYSYLMRLQDKKNKDGSSILKHLKIDTANTSKNLTIQLRIAFLQWLGDVFPHRTDPVSSFLWMRWLSVSRSNSDNEVEDAAIRSLGGTNLDPVVLKGNLLRAIHPMAVLETNSRGQFDEDVIILKTQLESRLLSLPTAIHYLFDGSDNHGHKYDLLTKYAREETQISERAAQLWGKKLNFLLKDWGLGDPIAFEEAKKHLKNKILSAIDGNLTDNEKKNVLDALFRSDVGYSDANGSSVSTKIYGLPPDSKVCEEMIETLLGDRICACKIECDVDKKPMKIWYVGLFLAGTAHARIDSGDSHRDELDVLRKHMTIAELFTVGNPDTLLRKLPDKVSYAIRNSNVWKDRPGKAGLIWLMVQSRKAT